MRNIITIFLITLALALCLAEEHPVAVLWVMLLALVVERWGPTPKA